ncbi:PKD domain-containing protein [Kineococcus xinjiangensis]|uniref:PKD domain-containing protein n=1 Tax=Kineococcus xinjiangensis TaxID=512762 RepID=UPI001304FF32|nr:PKD domain-containing protein [Kineococcus xinjiangensis]
MLLPVVTASDLRRLPLSGGLPAVQPGSGRVGINVPVNVYARAEPLTVSATVLGFPVRIRATPVSYTWDFGDGASLGPTRDPGAPYPRMRTTHTYARPGTYAVSLSTTYAGEYSVAGGEWLDIQGTVAVESSPVDLTALAATNVLVAP